ncbi:MAG TPA: nucleotidyltransferase family protein [Armatimonadota bacterium]|nr:nucleotidyltransferase family protein [Armatimonadota bacterium]
MNAIVVAAGRGTRLRPLTDKIPKALIPIQGVRLMDYILRGLSGVGVTDVVLVIRHLGDMIRETYGDSAFGMDIRYVEQGKESGTGAALLAAEGTVALGARSGGNEPFMLLWGDILADPMNYRRILAKYADHPCDLLSTLNWMDDPSTGASVETDGDRIIRIEEKPSPGRARSNWNQAGIFVCRNAVFEALRQCGLSPRGEIEFTAGVQKLIEMGKDVRWMPLEGFWSDVGTPEALERLQTIDFRL